jgi:hypothetical protein
MKPKIILYFALALMTYNLSARLERGWTESELKNGSDLIVVGTVIEVKGLNETNSLGWPQTELFRPKFRGVETTFKVSEILKGVPASDKIILHHYREESEWGSPPNGPNLISFTANSTNKYLLYLVKDGTNRFAPVTGQIDPRFSVSQR